jgi:ribonuclease HI
MFVATDGSCTNNGSPYAKAGFGVACENGTTISGPVKGFKVKAINYPEVVYHNVHQTPTNNRGELFGIMYALSYINTLPAGEFTIVTDSTYCKNIFTVWYKQWIERDTFVGKCNQDLITIIAPMFDALREKQYTINMIWQKAHLPKTQTNQLIRLNILADELANQGSSSSINISTIDL